jgi:glycine oxidase
LYKTAQNKNTFLTLMTHTSDITIIGGGIIGLLTARELVLAGFKVSILDKSKIGREASWAGGGILLPLYPWTQAQAITDLVLISLKKYPHLSSELLNTSGIDPEWYDCGLLISKNTDIKQATDWCEKNHITYQAAGNDFFNSLQTEAENPLWLPHIAQARNPRLIKSLEAFLLKSGVQFFENTEITHIQIENKRVSSIHTTQQSFKTGQLLIATGAWTSDFLHQLLPSLHQSLQIKPVKGQMLLFDAQPDTLPHMVLDGDQYLIPRRDGKILAGSTVEQSGFDKTTTEEAKTRLYQFATNLLPTLKTFPLSHHWAGLRPGTQDGVPYIGLHPEITNLSISAGHFRNGLVMGPASAELLADLILNRKPSLDPAPYQITQ